MEKITKREMFEALVAFATETEMEVIVGDTTVTSADFAAFAQKEIESLDKKSAKAKERSAAKRAEGDALLTAVYEVLAGADDFMTAADVATALPEDTEASLAKVSYRLGALVKDGKATKEDIKVDRDGKKSVLKGYRLM